MTLLALADAGAFSDEDEGSFKNEKRDFNGVLSKFTLQINYPERFRGGHAQHDEGR